MSHADDCLSNDYRQSTGFLNHGVVRGLWLQLQSIVFVSNGSRSKLHSCLWSFGVGVETLVRWIGLKQLPCFSIFSERMALGRRSALTHAIRRLGRRDVSASFEAFAFLLRSKQTSLNPLSPSAATYQIHHHVSSGHIY